MNEISIGILAIIVLLLLFTTGIELGFAMAVVGFVGFSYLVSFQAALDLLGRDVFEVFSSYHYTVFPLFMFMGQIGFNAGIAVRLYDAAYKFMGHIPGGVAMATVAGATAFKAICGSSSATSATFASVAVPQMDRYNYDRRLSTGIVASVGTLGCLIPPSVFLIILAIQTEQSVGRLFLAGMIPGLLTAVMFVGIIYGWAKLNPIIAPQAEQFAWRERFATLPNTIWVFITFLLVVGGIMKGFFSPTEAASVGTFLVLILSIVKKDIGFKGYVKSAKDALRTASMLLMLIAGSAVLGHFITATNIPTVAAEWIVNLPVNRYIILILITLVYQIGGSFIDDLAFVVLATPIFYPSILKLGFDPIWFCMIIAVTVMIGVVIPPMAICVFVVKNITKVPLGVIYKGVAPFLVALFILLILLLVFPQLSLWLPSVLMADV